MPFLGRGFAVVVCLLLLALACLSVVRKLDRERRLVAKLRSRGATGPGQAIPLDQLNDDERHTARSLVAAGVLGSKNDRCYLAPADAASFRRKRLKLLLSGAVGVAIVAIFATTIILTR